MTDSELMTALLALVPPAERDAINTPDTLPVYEAVVHALGVQSARRIRSAQASYMLPHSSQEGPPAAFSAPAFFTVTLDRTQNLDTALHIGAGKMRLDGPTGRTYVNTADIDYARRDALSEREVLFIATTLGTCGNLDFLVNDDLNIPKGLPAGWIRSEHMRLADQSRGRVGAGASFLQAEGSTAIKDSGLPDTFETSDAGLYVEITESAQPGVMGRLYRIRDHQWPGIEEPPNSNIRPTLALLDDFEVREQWMSVQQDDGGVFTDLTAAANDYVTLDVPLLTAAPADNDAIYFGAAFPITKLGLRIDQPGVGEWTIVWEFWDGVAWTVPPDLIDGTSGFTGSGLLSVTIKAADLQQTTTVNGAGPFYWVRARLTGFVSQDTQPIAGYGYPLTYQPLDDEAGTVRWAVRDWKDLGIVVKQVVQGQLGRDDDLYLLGDGRGLYPDAGETAEHFRRRISQVPDVVSPNALARVVNRILAPHELTCRIVDVGNLYLGFFFDQDAFDYYEAGDDFPLNPRRRLLSIWEAYGFTWVELPLVEVQDYGIFFDDGPVIFDPDKGVYIGPAFDGGFIDGKPFAGVQNPYSTIFKEILYRKGGGTDFALVQDPTLNVPP